MSDPTTVDETACNQVLASVACSELTPETIGLSSKAIFHSAAINQTDKFLDPVNYWIGMWGKLIILGAIKRQGMKQQIDPETNMHNLDWNNIGKDTIQRTPPKFKDILNEGTCRQWYQCRLRTYKEKFPYYKCYESATDQLIRHYSLQLVTLDETDPTSSKKFYWENWHGLPSSATGVLRSMEKNSQDTSPDLASLQGDKPPILPLSTFCTMGLKKTVCKDFPMMHASSKGDDGSKQNTAPTSGVRIYTTEGPFVTVSDQLHVVIEHNVPMSSPKPPLKRAQPVEENTIVVEDESKRRKVDGAEVNKAILLSVLWKLREGQGLLYEMSQIVTKKAEIFGDGWSCKYTLKRIEEKIRSGEITDMNTVMNACRCLLAYYVILKDDRKLTKSVIQMLDSLRKAAEHNL